MIKNIVFDFGNVLIDWNPRYLFAKLFSTQAELDSFMNEVWDESVWNLPLDLGVPLARQHEVMLLRYPQYEREINAYFTRWIETLGSPFYDTVELLYSLQKAGYKTYGLSNWSYELFQVVKKDLHFFDTLESIIMSGKEKIMKPALEIYEILLSRYNLTPQETVFIDDRAVNLKPATKLGIHTILFSNAKQTTEDLRKLGVSL
jgi:2-haloacid dehalogenase